MLKNFSYSFFDSRALPSTILEATETAARRTCDVNPNISSFGNDFVALYTEITKSSANSNALNFR